jgi:diadenosine tetraphosphate (Ap4A) HIT family hydrolase/CTP:molybdopterin cytidylyltransferase MocA
VSAERWIAVVLAAGKGTRMKSDLAKVLHEVDGRTLLGQVLETAARLPLARTIAVVGHQAGEVRRRHLAYGIETALQEPQLGTGHAVMAAAPLLESEPEDASLLVLYGDVPLLRAPTLLELMERHRLEENGVTVLTARLPDPRGYGRIVRDPSGGFLRITEDRDLAPEERAIDEINSGIYTFRLQPLLRALGCLRSDNAQGEYYLTDTLTLMAEEGYPVGTFVLADPDEIQGVNTVEQLEEAGAILTRRRLSHEGECPVCLALLGHDLVLERRRGMAVLLDPHPYNSGHLWVAPERHVVSAESLTAAESDLLWSLAREAEGWLEACYHPQAFNLGYNSGRQGEHLRLHVIPRWSGDSNFMPLIGGVNILPETLEGSRRRIVQARRPRS